MNKDINMNFGMVIGDPIKVNHKMAFLVPIFFWFETIETWEKIIQKAEFNSSPQVIHWASMFKEERIGGTVDWP